MSRASKVQPEQIEKARKLLRELPAQETPKSKEEAVVALTKEFREALKKGYTTKEISKLLRAEDIPLSESLIKKTLAVKIQTKRKNQTNSD